MYESHSDLRLRFVDVLFLVSGRQSVEGGEAGRSWLQGSDSGGEWNKTNDSRDLIKNSWRRLKLNLFRRNLQLHRVAQMSSTETSAKQVLGFVLERMLTESQIVQL